MKRILIIGLGWQGQKFIKYFLNNNNYITYGCCKTEKTKKSIEKIYNIKVYLDYNNAIKIIKPDLIISVIFPTNVQYDIVKDVLENYNVNVLIDLPISFNINNLRYLLSYNNLYIFNFEHYTKIYNYLNNNEENISSIDAVLFLNKDNLKKQYDPKKAINVDKFYCLNNLINIDFNIVDISYVFLEREIRDIEFIFTIKFNNGEVFNYKFCDGSGTLYCGKKITFEDNLNYNVVIPRLLDNIYSHNYDNIVEKEKHVKLWSYIFNK